MATGDFGAILAEKTLVTGINGTSRTSLAHATGITSCVLYHSIPTASIEVTLATFTINASTGAVSDVLDTEIVATIASTLSAGYVTKIRDGLVVVAINDVTNNRIQLRTFTIVADGTITFVDELTVSIVAISGGRPTVVRVTDTLIAVCYTENDGASHNIVETIDVDGSGNLGTIQDTQNFTNFARATTFGLATVGMAKVRDPDIWAIGEHLGGDAGDTLAVSFTINETTGAISAPIDNETFNGSAFQTDYVIPFLPETDGQFLISHTRNVSGTRSRRLVSYQVDGAADLGVDLDLEIVVSGGGTVHGGHGIYLGDRVVLYQQEGAATKRSFDIDAGGLIAAHATDSASAHTPSGAFFMHPPGFGNRMVMSYIFGTGDPHDIFISTFELENSIEAIGRRRPQLGWGLVRRSSVG